MNFTEAPTYELIVSNLKLFATEDMQDPHEWEKMPSLDILGMILSKFYKFTKQLYRRCIINREFELPIFRT